MRGVPVPVVCDFSQDLFSTCNQNMKILCHDMAWIMIGEHIISNIWCAYNIILTGKHEHDLILVGAVTVHIILLRLE